MAKERWTHSNTTVYNIGYHIIWCPKYRRKVLQSPVSDRLEVLLREKADELGVVIETMEIMPDHSNTPCTVGHSINYNSS